MIDSSLLLNLVSTSIRGHSVFVLHLQGPPPPMVLNEFWEFWEAMSYRQNVIQMSNAITQKTIVYRSVRHVSDKAWSVLSGIF